MYPGPHSHAPIELLPAADRVRFGHALHAVAPRASENVFAGHGIHTVEPFTSLKLPAAHAPHGSVPVVFLYFPTAHVSHGMSIGPVYPELHRQLEEHVPGVASPYTCTSSSCSQAVEYFDILTNLASPSQTCVLTQGAVMAPFCPVAQFVKVFPSLESCISKLTNVAHDQHHLFQIFIDLMSFVLPKSTCHQCPGGKSSRLI